MRVWFWLLLFIGVIVSLVLLWATSAPLGIPGEWEWRREVPEPDFLWNLVGAAAAAALLVAFVESGRRRLSTVCRSSEVAVWLTALVAVSMTWLWVVQEASPIKSRLGKSAFVLYYASSSGYFTKARYQSPDPAEFLATYEDLMRERDVLHVGTHPPGLFLVFHGLIAICQNPAVASCLDMTMSPSFQEACDIIARTSALSEPPRPLLPGDRRVLWAATLLVMITASLSVIPLYVLVRRTETAAVAWCAAALWTAVPAVAIFIPKSDVAYAFVGLMMVLSWTTAVNRSSVLLAFFAGVTTWLGLLMSLAFLPVALFMAIVGQRDVSQMTRDETLASAHAIQLPPVKCLVSGAVGFLLPIGLLFWRFQINLVAVWILNFQNHAAFYGSYPRTYWKWLLVNPVEFALAAGWPVALLAAQSLWLCVRSRPTTKSLVPAGVLFVGGLLWLTGKNSGEAARLWIVFLPWLVWLAGMQISRFDDQRVFGRFHPIIAILGLQLLVCLLTVVRISGFEM